MRLSLFALVCFVVCLAIGASAFAQGTADPVSGTWSGDWGPNRADRNQVSVMLKWDGKALTGTVNPGPSAVQLQSSKFDPKSGAIHMEANAPAPGGATYRYIIDGKVENGTMIGSWNHDNRKGDFKITKK